MKLYHGSNQAVREPEIRQSKRALDFGTGFYLTSDFEQAKRWAQRTTKSRSVGITTVSVYDFNEYGNDDLKVLKFSAADEEWLHYISDNRKGKIIQDKYDIVIGPVANDQVIRTVNLYLEGYLTEEMAVQLLMSQKLTDQYTFKTEKGLKYLCFEEAIPICSD